ncbi:MAG TPA: hypothetical protein VEI03_18995 [Stellaceae bacterium]|nr:hypothetical protein [Stellaceae bacterium]
MVDNPGKSKAPPDSKGERRFVADSAIMPPVKLRIPMPAGAKATAKPAQTSDQR